MLIFNIISLIKATTLKRILFIFNRLTITLLLLFGTILCDALYASYVVTGLGAFNSLFHITEITYSFSLDFYLLSVTPIVVYPNAASDKDKAIKENINKGGIY